MCRQNRLKLFSTFLFLLSGLAFSYPEMLRHNYTSCTACHVSPNGGGMLTPYGHTLSSELLSSFGSEKQAGFMHGFVKHPEWMGIGGDVRWAETYLNSSTLEKYRFIFMQADVEPGFFYKQFSLVGTLGYQNKDSLHYTGSSFISRRHYLMWQPDEHTAVRAGRFYPAYGINVADHMVATRRSLGWDEGEETYNLEASYSHERFEVFLTGIFGRPEEKSLHKDTGVALRAGLNFWEGSKVGLGYYYGKNDKDISRHLTGPFLILGFTHHLYLLEEMDFVTQSTPTTTTTSGLVNYARLGYEFYKGVHVFLSQEYAKMDFTSDLTRSQAYGLGFIWYPIPHVETTIQYTNRKTDALGTTAYDFAYFMFHYYF